MQALKPHKISLHANCSFMSSTVYHTKQACMSYNTPFSPSPLHWWTKALGYAGGPVHTPQQATTYPTPIKGHPVCRNITPNIVIAQTALAASGCSSYEAINNSIIQ